MDCPLGLRVHKTLIKRRKQLRVASWAELCIPKKVNIEGRDKKSSRFQHASYLRNHFLRSRNMLHNANATHGVSFSIVHWQAVTIRKAKFNALHRIRHHAYSSTKVIPAYWVDVGTHDVPSVLRARKWKEGHAGTHVQQKGTTSLNKRTFSRKMMVRVRVLPAATPVVESVARPLIFR